MTPRCRRRHREEEEEQGEEKEDYTEENREMVFQGVIAARYLNLLHIAFQNANISLTNTLPTLVKWSIGSFFIISEDFLEIRNPFFVCCLL